MKPKFHSKIKLSFIVIHTNSLTFILQAVDAPEQGGAGPRRDKVVLCLRFSVCGSVFAVLPWLCGFQFHLQFASI